MIANLVLNFQGGRQIELDDHLSFSKKKKIMEVEERILRKSCHFAFDENATRAGAPAGTQRRRHRDGQESRVADSELRTQAVLEQTASVAEALQRRKSPSPRKNTQE